MNIFKVVFDTIFPPNSFSFGAVTSEEVAAIRDARNKNADNASKTFLASLQPELPNPYEVRLTAEQAKNLYEFAAAGIRVAQTNPDANTVDEDTVNEMIESVRGPINLLGAIGARVVQ